MFIIGYDVTLRYALPIFVNSIFFCYKKLEPLSLIRHDRIITEQSCESIFSGLEIETRIHVRKL